MAVVPGTATSMVKKLAKAGLVKYEAYSGVRLTAKGKRLALLVLRRHRLVETLLVESFGLDWSEVHDEADRLEHAISDKLLERIDAFLGHPVADPHGDPIPDHTGRLPAASIRRLIECHAGESVRISRVVDQDQAFLKFISRHGLKPGTQVAVEEIDDVSDSVVIKPGRKEPVTMGGAAARKLLVESV
jgi:DtxR family Mn-dependent transcriptional regulator